jgi:ABC-type hemin transport system substrate-binding protein
MFIIKVKNNNPGVKRVFLFLAAAFLLVFLSCGRMDRGEQQGGGDTPERIVSLSPSLTRQVIDLGAETRLVGVTSWHPPLKRKVPVVGSLVHPSLEKILALEPDLVILSREDGAVQRTGRLKDLGLRVHVFERNDSWSHIAKNYLELARLLGLEGLGRENMDLYRRELESLDKSVNKRAAIILSHAPLVTVSSRAFPGDALRRAGGINVFSHLGQRYAPVTLEALLVARPEVLLVTSRPAVRWLKGRLEKAGRDIRVRFIEHDPVSYYAPKEFVESVRIMGEALREVR